MPLVAEASLTPSVVEGRIRYTMNNALSLSREVGDRQESSVMEAVGGKWSIEVYLGGDGEEYRDYVSVFLHWKGKLEDRPKDICYLLRAVNQSDPTRSEERGGPQEKWEADANSTGEGWAKLIPTDTLLDPTEGFLVDDRVIFEAELTRTTGTSSSRVDEMQEAPATLSRDNMALLEVCACV